ncbi:MAG: FtsX-like permease family protein [Acidobacteriota bacterium]
MSLLPRLRLSAYVAVFAVRDIFPVSFYGRDLRERLRTLSGSLRSCISTFLNLTTLAILVVTTSLVAALQVGAVNWLQQYLESNPLARTVEVSSIFSTRTAAFEQADLEALRRLAVPGDGGGAVRPITGVFGWNDVTFWFIDEGGDEDQALTHGRTVHPDDPLLSRLDYAAGDGRFSGDGVAEIIVSRSLLRSLGYPDEAPFPEILRLDYAELKAPMKVLGVAESTPAGDFLITEAFHRSIQDLRWNPLPTTRGFYWGPVAPSAPLSELLSTLAPFLERLDLRVDHIRRGGNEMWLRFERDDGWTPAKWRQLALPGLEGRLALLDVPGVVEFFENDPSTIKAFGALEPEYTRASIYVGRLAQVPAVSDAVSAEGFHVTSNSREIALIFLQASSMGRSILFGVIAVVGGLAAVSLVLSISQSIQRKTPEIAILKAYGASNALVLGAYLMEALVLWALSTGFGLVVAGGVAAAVDVRVVSLLRLRGALPEAGEVSLISLPLWLQGGVALGALVLCLGSTIVAGSLAVRLQPARALSLHR